MELTIESRISRVVVHARGALVTRSVPLPDDLPAGKVDVCVPELTALAQAGSIRASFVEGARLVTAVRAELVMPDRTPEPGPTARGVRDAALELERLQAERTVVAEQRERIGATKLVPSIRAYDGNKRKRDELDARLADVGAMQALLDETCAALDVEVRGLDLRIRAARKALEAAKLADEQASSKARMGPFHPTRRAVVRVAGEGKPGVLELTYAVQAARWWPAYTLRISRAGTLARWLFEAVLAQRTGEDWSGVPLSLSSGDLAFDVRLPELSSLRFSRAQPPARRPYRAPPDGLEGMFASYLAFGVGAFLVEARDYSDAATSTEAELTRAISGGFDEAAVTRELAAAGGAPRDDAPDPEQDDAETIVFAGALPQQALGARSAGAPAGGAAPAAPMMMMPSAPAASFGAVPSLAPARGRASMPLERGESVADEPAPLPEPAIVPSETWYDYDALVLAHADDPVSRGRLVRRPEQGARSMARQATTEIERAGGDLFQDPLETRGVFDHRYDAGALANVPADGRLHRVSVASRDCAVEVRWAAVPCEAAEVFREAVMTNPFESPLLGGPVDVYLDGSLLTTSSIRRIDKGGSFRCGMGVDPRVKIARNVRSTEESAGLLGGSTAVTHEVTIELSTSTEEPIKVEVRERFPVTDDKNIEIKAVGARPTPEPYDQSERGSALRGGRRFVVDVAPGKKALIEHSYKLVFPSKMDIVGGSRRG